MSYRIHDAGLGIEVEAPTANEAADLMVEAKCIARFGHKTFTAVRPEKAAEFPTLKDLVMDDAAATPPLENVARHEAQPEKTRGQAIADQRVWRVEPLRPGSPSLVHFEFCGEDGFRGWDFQLPLAPQFDPVESIRKSLGDLIDCQRADAAQEERKRIESAVSDLDLRDANADQIRSDVLAVVRFS